MKVRNQLHSQKSYEGQLVYAFDLYCPCRPCWYVYHFPEWNRLGKRIDYPECWYNHHYGCPEPLPLPTHIFYNSKRFQNRKKGDKFRCLRCGQPIALGVDNCNWITVPYRKKDQIVEFLKREGLRA